MIALRFKLRTLHVFIFKSEFLTTWL